MSRIRGLAGPLAIMVAVGALGYVFGGLWPDAAQRTAVADEPPWPPAIDARRTVDGDQETGELLVNESVVIQLRAATDEMSPHERAVVAAERLKLRLGERDAMQAQAGFRDGEHVVLVNDSVIATVLPGDLPEGMPPQEGAETWAQALASAMGIRLADPQEAAPWQPDEPYADKIVPLFSLGKGKRIGAARVNGPESKVAQTQAVAQIETRMLKWFEVQIYVPISTKVPGQDLQRVQGVAVTGVGDFRL
jgi:hypothetical protein